MKKPISFVIDNFKKGSNNRFFNKVGWLEVERRVYEIYNDVKIELGEDQEILGRLYIESTRQKPEFKASNRTVIDVINSIHIYTGQRNLGTLEIGNYTKPVMEKNAQMVFSQGPHGGITVFLFPYKTSIHEVTEKNIAIGYYESTNQLTKKEIRKLFMYFLKYCFASSLDSLSYKPFKNYAFRKFLHYKDFRNKTSYMVKFFKLIERLTILLLGLGAILATIWSAKHLL